MYDAEIVHPAAGFPWRAILSAYFVSGPFAGALTFIYPELAPWYVNYVLLVSFLTVPALSSGGIRIGRQLAGCLCVSSLPTFASAIWLAKAVVMVSTYWGNLDLCLAYAGVILLVCVTSGMVSVYSRTLFSTDRQGLAFSYVGLTLLYVLPLPLWYFGDSAAQSMGFTSPFFTVLTLPKINFEWTAASRNGQWHTLFGYAVFSVALNVILLALVLRNRRLTENSVGV